MIDEPNAIFTAPTGRATVAMISSRDVNAAALFFRTLRLGFSATGTGTQTPSTGGSIIDSRVKTRYNPEANIAMGALVSAVAARSSDAAGWRLATPPADRPYATKRAMGRARASVAEYSIKGLRMNMGRGASQPYLVA